MGNASSLPAVTFDLSTQAGVTEALYAVRTSGLTPAQRNSLRDEIFSYTKSGGDKRLREMVQEKLQAIPLSEDFLHTHEEHQKEGATAGFAKGRKAPRFAVQSTPAAPVTQSAPPSAPPQTPTPAQTTPEVNVAEQAQVPDSSPSQAQVPVAQESGTEAESAPDTQPPAVAPKNPSLDRIREIKRAVNQAFGSPVALVDVDEEVGREYMTALLEAMQSVNADTGLAGDQQIQRLETVFSKVEQIISQPPTSADTTPAQPTERMASSHAESDSKSSVPPIQSDTGTAKQVPAAISDNTDGSHASFAPTELDQSTVSGQGKSDLTPKDTEVSVTATPPPPVAADKSDFPPTNLPTAPSESIPNISAVYDTPPTPSPSPKPAVADSVQSEVPIKAAQPSEAQKAAVVHTDNTEKTHPTDGVTPVAVNNQGQNRWGGEKSTVTDSVASAGSNIDIKSTAGATPPTLGVSSVGQKPTPSASDVGPKSSAPTVAQPPSVAHDMQDSISSKLQQLDAVAQKKNSHHNDPLFDNDVENGLDQLLMEWKLFKASGLFGTGPHGREHPLFKQLAPMFVSDVVQGKFDGSKAEIIQSIIDYMNGWRYEQGIVHEAGETFEMYLRRVIRFILDSNG